MSDLPALREIQRRWNGEVALYDSNQREWVAISMLDLETAAETGMEVVIRSVG